MNSFQTREERKQEIRQTRRREFWIIGILFVGISIIALERGCENDDPPMFVKTESSAN
jgi:hypothetical protein